MSSSLLLLYPLLYSFNYYTSQTSSGVLMYQQLRLNFNIQSFHFLSSSLPNIVIIIIIIGSINFLAHCYWISQPQSKRENIVIPWVKEKTTAEKLFVVFLMLMERKWHSCDQHCVSLLQCLTKKTLLNNVIGVWTPFLALALKVALIKLDEEEQVECLSSFVRPLTQDSGNCPNEVSLPTSCHCVFAINKDEWLPNKYGCFNEQVPQVMVMMVAVLLMMQPWERWCLWCCWS